MYVLQSKYADKSKREQTHTWNLYLHSLHLLSSSVGVWSSYSLVRYIFKVAIGAGKGGRRRWWLAPSLLYGLFD